jgi:hypothetical protein
MNFVNFKVLGLVSAALVTGLGVSSLPSPTTVAEGTLQVIEPVTRETASSKVLLVFEDGRKIEVCDRDVIIPLGTPVRLQYWIFSDCWWVEVIASVQEKPTVPASPSILPEVGLMKELIADLDELQADLRAQSRNESLGPSPSPPVPPDPYPPPLPTG